MNPKIKQQWPYTDKEGYRLEKPILPDIDPYFSYSVKVNGKIEYFIPDYITNRFSSN